MKRLALITITFILGMFALAYVLAPEWTQQGAPKSRSSGTAQIGGDFTLTDHRGQPFTQKDLLGQYHLLFFGFTHCPDICPTSLLTLAEAMQNLPESLQERIQPVFVSVDPGRDTPEILAQYVANFHPRLIGLTGTEAQIRQIADAYKVYYSVSPPNETDGSYLVDHSGFLFLMDPKGNMSRISPTT